MYITAGRKWGKLLFASAIMKLLTLYDTSIEPGAEVYSIATVEDQNKAVFVSRREVPRFDRQDARQRKQKQRRPESSPRHRRRVHAVPQDNGQRHVREAANRISSLTCLLLSRPEVELDLTQKAVPDEEVYDGTETIFCGRDYSEAA